MDAEKKQKAHPRADQNKRRTTMSTKMPAAPATSSTAGPWSLNYAIGHIGGEGHGKRGRLNADLSDNDREGGAARV